jgi:hypothetical protein
LDSSFGDSLRDEPSSLTLLVGAPMLRALRENHDARI